MAGIDFTSTDLIDKVVRRAAIPDSQNLYDEDEICKILTEELHSDIVPLIMGVREEYLVTNYDQAISSSQTGYRIPPRAFAQKLHDAVLLNSDGFEVGIPRAQPSQLKKRFAFGGDFRYPDGTCFFFEDDKVVIYPDTSNVAGTYQLRMKYFRRPNNIVKVADAGQITAINTGTKQVTLANLPSAWTTATIFDFIKGQPSFDTLGDDKAITAVDSTNSILTFSATLPSELAVGDWVGEAGFSPIAQIPYEIHNLLAQRAVIKILEGLGDRNGLQSAADVYKDMVDKFKTMVTPRADGSPKKIIRGGSGVFGGARRLSGW